MGSRPLPERNDGNVMKSRKRSPATGCPFQSPKMIETHHIGSNSHAAGKELRLEAPG